jgi:multidrug resistance efflux pump
MTPTHSLDTPLLQNGSVPLDVRVRSLRLAEKPASPPRANIIPWALCVILLLTTAAFGYRAYRVGSLMAAPSTETPAAAAPLASDPPPTPSAPPAVTGDIVLQSKGYVVSAHQVKIGVKVGGTVAKVSERLEEGKFFKAGEPLAWLETDDYEAEYQHAVAVREAAKQRYDELEHGNRPQEVQASLNELKEAEANLEQLERDVRRNQQLMGTAALTAKDYEQARYAREAMFRRVARLRFAYDLMEKGARKEKRDAAKADWKAAEADEAKAKWRLDNCIIRAPFAGHLLSKNVEVGSVVTTQSFIGELANLGDLEIEVSVQERDVARVQMGQRCNVMPEAFQSYEPFRKLHPRGYQGRVARLMPLADRSKGAVNVRIRIENIPEHEIGKILRPEMSALVSFLR